MKKILFAGLLVSVSSMAMAEVPVSGPWFIGGIYGQSSLNVDTKPSDSSVGADVKAATKGIDDPHFYGIRGGVYMSPNVRVYATYTYSDADSSYDGVKVSNTNQTLLGSADYLFGQQAIKPFVGVSVGVNRVEAKSFQSDDNTGFTYGAQAGLNWRVTPSMALEAGYQYLKNDNSVNTVPQADGGPVKSDLDNTQNVYVSVDYQF